MDTERQPTGELTKLADIVNDIEFAMLTTVDLEGSLRSRPLATRQFDSDGGLWFFTSISSGKIAEIDSHRRVNLSYSRPAHQNYASISGVTQVIRDEAKARELWTPMLLAWFPDGVDDPDLVLLRVLVEEAEYWDLPTGRSYRLPGRTPPPDHSRIDLTD
jgi:general stress protein 26